jgi:hypothetical protein
MSSVPLDSLCINSGVPEAIEYGSFSEASVDEISSIYREVSERYKSTENTVKLGKP